MPPSTAWEEIVAEGEQARFEEATARLIEIQKSRSAKYGRGRALHRKGLLGLHATLDVLPDLVEHAAQGLFAKPATYEARVRLSNGGMEVASDKRPDIRGFAIKVLGVEGEGTFGGPASSQDFLLIDRSTFGFSRPEPFFELLFAASKGVPAVIWHLLKTRGLFGGLRMLGELTQDRFRGFAHETFFSAAPIACGRHAVRVRLVPTAREGEGPAVRKDDLSADIIERLAAGPLEYRLQLQFFVDEARTPIEDAAVDWAEADAPYVDVARLVVGKQAPTGTEGATLADEIETLKFDPWSALAAHRPLGSIMRARKVAYLASQNARAEKD